MCDVKFNFLSCFEKDVGLLWDVKDAIFKYFPCIKLVSFPHLLAGFYLSSVFFLVFTSFFKFFICF